MDLLRSTVLIAFAVGATGGVAAASADTAAEPESVLQQATQGLAHAQGYHLRVIADGQGVATADILADGTGRATIVDGRARVSVVVTKSMSYIKGTRAFWEDGDEGPSPKLTRKLANRWLQEVTTEEYGTQDEYRLEITAMLDDLRPRVLSKCLIGRTGTLTPLPAATVDGQAATVLRDAGDKPGSAPRRISVRATAPILPLRIVQTGPRRKGEPRTRTCAASLKDTTDRRSEIRLSRFGRVGPVTAPRGAVTVSQALKG